MSFKTNILEAKKSKKKGKKIANLLINIRFIGFFFLSLYCK